MMRVHDSDEFQALRLYVIRRWPYYTPAMLHFVPVETDEKIPEFLRLDSRMRLYYNPDQLRALMENQEGREVLAFRMAHLINHWLRKHSQRLGLHVTVHGRFLVELASDLEINDDLLGEVRLPQWMRVAYPEAFQLPPGLLAEEYLSRLQEMLPFREIEFPAGTAPSPGEDGEEKEGDGQSVKENWQQSKGGSGIDESSLKIRCGSCVHGVPDELEKKANELRIQGVNEEDEYVARLQTATAIQNYYRSHGRVPAGLLRIVEDLIHPRVDWRLDLVAAFNSMLAPHSGSRPSFRRPSRRQSVLERIAGEGVLFPSHYSRQPRVAVVIDTSASMEDVKLRLAKGAVAEILKTYGSYVTVICTDAQAYEAQQVFTPHEIQLIGGGGTVISHGIEKACGLDVKPDVIVVITDGLTDWMEQPPSIPVMVLLLGDEGSAPDWAKHVVRISERDIRRLTS